MCALDNYWDTVLLFDRNNSNIVNLISFDDQHSFQFQWHKKVMMVPLQLDICLDYKLCNVFMCRFSENKPIWFPEDTSINTY